MSKTIRFAVVLSAAVLFAGAVSFAQSAGEATYKAKCQSCHGAEGTPNAGIAKLMGVKAVSDPSVKGHSAAEMIADYKQWQGQDAGVQRQAHRCAGQGLGGLLPFPCQVRASVF